MNLLDLMQSVNVCTDTSNVCSTCGFSYYCLFVVHTRDELKHKGLCDVGNEHKGHTHCTDVCDEARIKNQQRIQDEGKHLDEIFQKQAQARLIKKTEKQKARRQSKLQTKFKTAFLSALEQNTKDTNNIQ